jgi:hypothetical protein
VSTYIQYRNVKVNIAKRRFRSFKILFSSGSKSGFNLSEIFTSKKKYSGPMIPKVSPKIFGLIEEIAKRLKIAKLIFRRLSELTARRRIWIAPKNTRIGRTWVRSALSLDTFPYPFFF